MAGGSAPGGAQRIARPTSVRLLNLDLPKQLACIPLSAHLISMNLLNVGAMLAMGQSAAPGTQPDPKGQALYTGGMLVIMIVMF